MANSRTLVQDNDARLLQLRNHGAGAVTRRLDDTDPLVDNGLRVGAVVGRVERGQQGDVYGEGVLGQRAALADLLLEVVGRREDQRRDDAQTAGVGDCGGELGVAYVLFGGERGRRVSVCRCWLVVSWPRGFLLWGNIPSCLLARPGLKGYRLVRVQ